MALPAIRGRGPLQDAHAESFETTSRAGADYRISVGLPMSYGVSGRMFPVLYVVDGDAYFHTVHETSRVRALVGEIGEIIVVGVGYPTGSDVASWAQRRNMEFSGADWDFSTPLARDLQDLQAALGQPLRIGGAESFLDFVVDELQPIILRLYEVDANDQAIIGHSAGGNFVGRVLFSRPEAFGKYIIGSPTFAYNDWEVLRLEETYAENHDDLCVRVYLAAAAGEALQVANFSILSGTTKLAERLCQRGYPGLQLACDVLPGESHVSSYTALLQRGIEMCWPGTPQSLSSESASETWACGGLRFN